MMAETDNPSVSINFDAAALHDADEAEYRREEQERQNELRALLTSSEFDLGLSDEEEDSDISRDTSRHQSDTPELPVPNQQLIEANQQPPEQDSGADSWAHGHDVQYIEEEVCTPRQLYPQHQELAENHGNTWQESADPHNHLAQYPHLDQQPDPESVPQPLPNHHDYQLEPSHDPGLYGMGEDVIGTVAEQPYTQDRHPEIGYHGNYDIQLHQQEVMNDHPHFIDERGEVEGENNADHQDQYGMVAMQPPYSTDMGPYTAQTQYAYATTADNDMYRTEYTGEDQYVHLSQPPNNTVDGVLINEDPGMNSHYTDIAAANIPRGHPSHAQVPAKANYMTYDGSGVAAQSNSVPGMDHYKVQYNHTGVSGTAEVMDHAAAVLNTEQGSIPRPTTPGGEQPGEYEDMQADYLKNAGSGVVRQFEQLQILYKARGHKVDQLTHNLAELREENDREVRILKHRITMLQDERDGAIGSVEQNQGALREATSRETTMKAEVAAMQARISSLQSGRDELIQKLTAAEATIESLHVQLEEMGASESLTRAKHQHESTVSAMHQTHSMEMLGLKEKIDDLTRRKEEKDTEVFNLRKQVSELLKNSEEKQLDRADMINRLTRSLEESQHQVEDLLESGSGREVSQLKMQIQEVIAGKSISEDLSAALAEENQELKQQVMIYESVSQFGVLGGVSTSTKIGADFDDSYAQLGIKKGAPTDWKTPTGSPEPSGSASGFLTAEETVTSLKQELERCLTMYRAKRIKVGELQEQMTSSKTRIVQLETRLQQTEKETTRLQEQTRILEVNANDGTPTYEMRLKHLETERDNLHAELQVLQKRLEETAASEENLTELNQELSSQMSQMIRDFDEDKKTSLEKCQEACLQHHESAQEQLRHQLESELSSETNSAIEQYEAKVVRYGEEIAMARNELDTVKEMYVNACHEKDQIEAEMQRECDHKLEQQAVELRAAFVQEKQEDVHRAQKKWEEESKQALAASKEKWQSEIIEEHNHHLEAELARHKVEWFREHQSSRDLACQRAVEAKDLEWQAKWETSLTGAVEQRLSTERGQWEIQQRTSMEAEVYTHSTHSKADAEQAVEAARKEWTTQQEQREQQLNSQFEIEREKWKTQMNKIQEMHQNQEATYQEARKEVASLIAKMSSLENDIQQKESAWHQEKIQLDVILTLKQQQLESALEKHKQQIEAAWKAELQRKETSWQQERQQLDHDLEAERKMADLERRKAVQAVEEQCEQDYRSFLGEHNQTLNKALASSEVQHSKELIKLKQSHKDDLDALKSSLHELEAKHIKELEQKFAKESEEAEVQRLGEREMLVSTHRQSLAQALQEAKVLWQKERIAETAVAAAVAEPMWHVEKARLLTELEERDSLLRSADSHMEDEVQKLQLDLVRQHQVQLKQEVEQLHQQLQDQGVKQLQDMQHELSAHSEREVDRHVELLRQQMDADFQTKVSAAAEREIQALQRERTELQSHLNDLTKDKEALMAELDALDGQLKGLEANRDEERRDSQQAAEESRAQLRDAQGQAQELRHELEAKIVSVNELEQRRLADEHAVEQLRAEVQAAEGMRSELMAALKKVEKENSQILSAHVNSQQELNEKVKRLEKHIRGIETKFQRKLAAQHDSLEREHEAALENLKGKMLEVGNSHLNALDNCRRGHSEERLHLQRQVDQLRSQVRQVNHTPTQTDEALYGNETLHELRDQYLSAVHKMKAEVLSHVNHSTDCAADTVRQEVVKERHLTARRLRRYYMRCLNNLLDKDHDSAAKKEKMAIMENFLDNIPSRSTSRTTSGATTPNLNSDSRSSTPAVTLTQANISKSNHGWEMGGSHGNLYVHTISSKSSSNNNPRERSAVSLSPRARVPVSPTTMAPTQHISPPRQLHIYPTSISADASPTYHQDAPFPWVSQREKTSSGQFSRDAAGAQFSPPRRFITERIIADRDHRMPAVYGSQENMLSLDGDQSPVSSRAMSLSTPNLATPNLATQEPERDECLTPTPQTPGYAQHPLGSKVLTRHNHKGSIPELSTRRSNKIQEKIKQKYRNVKELAASFEDSFETSTPRDRHDYSSSNSSIEQAHGAGDNTSRSTGYNDRSWQPLVQSGTLSKSVDLLTTPQRENASNSDPSRGCYRYTSIRSALSTDRLPTTPKNVGATYNTTAHPNGKEFGANRQTNPGFRIPELDYRTSTYNTPAEKLQPESSDGDSTPTPDMDTPRGTTALRRMKTGNFGDGAHHRSALTSTAPASLSTMKFRGGQVQPDYGKPDQSVAGSSGNHPHSLVSKPVTEGAHRVDSSTGALHKVQKPIALMTRHTQAPSPTHRSTRSK